MAVRIFPNLVLSLCEKQVAFQQQFSNHTTKKSNTQESGDTKVTQVVKEVTHTFHAWDANYSKFTPRAFFCGRTQGRSSVRFRFSGFFNNQAFICIQGDAIQNIHHASQREKASTALLLKSYLYSGIIGGGEGGIGHGSRRKRTTWRLRDPTKTQVKKYFRYVRVRDRRSRWLHTIIYRYHGSPNRSNLWLF